MKKELWVGAGVCGAAAAFTLIVSLIIQMNSDRPDYKRAIAYSLLAGGGGFLAGSLGAFWALSDEEKAVGMPKRVDGGDRALPLPQPVENLKLLGSTEREQWSTIARHSAASHPTHPQEVLGLLDRVGRVGQPVATAPAEDLLPVPAPQDRPEAIPMPVPRYEQPVVQRMPPSTPTPTLYGMEEDDLWGVQDDSMSASGGEETEDIFA